MKRDTLPFDLHIPEPCTQPWSGMLGDHAQRHCESCHKQVHNLAALTQRQIARLILQSTGPICGRITRDQNADLVTSDRSGTWSFAASATLATALITISPLRAHGQQGPAIVSGRVISSPDAGNARGVSQLILSQNGQPKALIQTNEAGEWQTQVPPGTYDLAVIAGAFSARLDVHAVALHSGHQAFDNLQPQATTQMVFVGELQVIRKNRYLWAVKHPISTIKALSRRYL